MNSSTIQHLTRADRLNRLFIDGEWVLPAGQAGSSVIDTSTEESIAGIALGSAQDAPVGSVLAANAGDALFVLQGAPIGWESSERVPKFYVAQNLQS